jgi:colanic acid/amylovoran biosynthesis glycosyltransferase
MYEKLFTTASVVTTNSNFTAQAVAALGCPQKKLFRLPVGVNLADFPFCERTLQPGQSVRIVTVARLVEIKGHEFALRAIAALAKDYPSLRYDIIGDGPLLPKLEKLRSELRLEGTVTFHGARDRSFVVQTMAGAHIALLGSRSVDGDQEGQGLFIQEAQASGLPVVATAQGGLPEGLLPGKSGYLVPQADSNALASQLRFLLEHPGQWPEMGRAGRAFVEQHFDIARLNRRLEKLYHEMATQHQHRGTGFKPVRLTPPSSIKLTFA